MYRVTGVQPLSWAKTYTLATIAIVVVAVLLVLIPLLIVAGFSAVASSDANEVGGFFGLAAMMVAAALAFAGAISLVAFVASLIQGAVFNWALGRTGGVVIDLALAGALDETPAATDETPTAADETPAAPDEAADEPHVGPDEAADEPPVAPDETAAAVDRTATTSDASDPGEDRG